MEAISLASRTVFRVLLDLFRFDHAIGGVSLALHLLKLFGRLLKLAWMIDGIFGCFPSFSS